MAKMLNVLLLQGPYFVIVSEYVCLSVCLSVSLSLSHTHTHTHTHTQRQTDSHTHTLKTIPLPKNVQYIPIE